jgi:hypothetical protein
MSVDVDGSLVTTLDVTAKSRQGLVYGLYIEDTDLDTGENKDTLIVTGRNCLFIQLELEAFGGQVVAEIHEGATVSAYGTEIFPQPFNRNFSARLTSKFYAAPTVVSTGNKFVARRVLAYAQGSSAIASSVAIRNPRILKPLTAYLLRQTGVSDNIAMTLTCTLWEDVHS